MRTDVLPSVLCGWADIQTICCFWERVALYSCRSEDFALMWRDFQISMLSVSDGRVTTCIRIGVATVRRFDWLFVDHIPNRCLELQNETLVESKTERRWMSNTPKPTRDPSSSPEIAALTRASDQARLSVVGFSSSPWRISMV